MMQVLITKPPILETISKDNYIYCIIFLVQLVSTSVRYQGMSAEAEYSMFNQILKTLKPRDLIYENRSSCKRKKFHKENPL